MERVGLQLASGEWAENTELGESVGWFSPRRSFTPLTLSISHVSLLSPPNVFYQTGLNYTQFMYLVVAGLDCLHVCTAVGKRQIRRKKVNTDRLA